MRDIRSAVAAVVVAWSLAATAAWPCTTVLLEDRDAVVVAKSYDYFMAQGLILVNPRGLAKRSMLYGASRRPASWVSRYGSVTFNQYGRELPCGGMNEAGLVVEVMWLDETVYPPADDRPVLPDLQWIQYQLDRWASVDEVVAHAGEVRVESGAARVHFLVCDASASCAAVEYLDGALVVTAGDDMPVRALTNSPYAASMAYAADRGVPMPGAGSLERFSRAAAAAGRGDRGAPGLVDDGFAALDGVSQGSGSVWNIVYQPRQRRIHYRTRDHRRIKRIEMKEFRYACDQRLPALDIDAERWGDVTSSFLELSVAMHRQLVRRSFARHFGPVQKGTVEFIVSFAHPFRCAPPPAEQH